MCKKLLTMIGQSNDIEKCRYASSIATSLTCSNTIEYSSCQLKIIKTFFLEMFFSKNCFNKTQVVSIKLGVDDHALTFLRKTADRLMNVK